MDERGPFSTAVLSFSIVEPAVFLDRDNTLIESDGDLTGPERVRLKHGVGPGLQALHEAGYRLVVVTNQGGVARGAFTEEQVDAVHQRIARLLSEGAGEAMIDRFYYCPYDPEGQLAEFRREHPWRKPNPGMLLQAAQDMTLDLTRSWMIGDQPRDMQAGHAAGCRTILVASNGGAGRGPVKPTATVETFDQAVQAVLGAAPRQQHPDSPRLTGSAGSMKGSTSDAGGEIAALRRSMVELAEEVRADRLRSAEFTPLKLAAGACQLLTLLLALLGLLQLDTLESFARWMLGALLVQLITITLLLLDQRG